MTITNEDRRREAPPPARSRFFWSFVKIAVSLGLLLLILGRIDMEGLRTAFGRLSWPLFIASVALTFGRILVAILRWQLVLRSRGHRQPFTALAIDSIISSFYNLGLPSTIGGDAYRVVALGRRISNLQDAGSSVLFERFMGFASLCVISLVAVALGARFIQGTGVAAAVVLLFLFYVVVLALLFSPRIVAHLYRRLDRLIPAGVIEKVESFHVSLASYRETKGTVATCFGLSLGIQVLGICVVYLIGVSLTLDVAFIYYLVFIPLVWVVIMIPISISGIGLREGAFVYFFGMVGMPAEEALLLSLLMFSHPLAIGALGGLMQIGRATGPLARHH